MVDHLGIVWQATPIGAIDPEDYYDFQVNRPRGRDRGRSTREPHLADDPAVAGAGAPSGGDRAATGLNRDVVLVRGIEPNMRWRAFCEELLRGLPKAWASRWWSLLGALLADTPHTRPVPVPVGASNAKLRQRARAGAAGPTTRGRPGSSGCCSTPATGAGLPAVSLWAAVPHYVGAAALPQGHPGAAAGASRTSWTRRCRWPTCRRRPGPGSGGSTSWPSRTPRSPSTCGPWRRPRTPTDLPEASGDAIAREFERYFRRHGGTEEPGGI